MKSKNIFDTKFQGGYVGLLSLLIAVTIMGFLAVKVYEKSNSTESGKAGDGRRETGLEGDPRGKSSIEKAQDAKNLMELQSRQSMEADTE